MTEIKAEVPMAEMLEYAPGPAGDHGRAGRVLDGARALRGGPRTRGTAVVARAQQEQEAVRA